MDITELIAQRNELRKQAREIRIGSRDLTGDAYIAAQQAHRDLMGSIRQLHEAIQNHR